MFPLRKTSGGGKSPPHTILGFSLHVAWKIAVRRALPGSWAATRLRHSREGSGQTMVIGQGRSPSRKGRTAASESVALATSRSASDISSLRVSSVRYSSSYWQAGRAGERRACRARNKRPSSLAGTLSRWPASGRVSVFAHKLSKQSRACFSIPGNRKWMSIQQGHSGWWTLTECLGNVLLSGSTGRSRQPRSRRPSSKTSRLAGSTKTSTSADSLASRSPWRTLAGPLMKKTLMPRLSARRATRAWPRSTPSRISSCVLRETWVTAL